MPSSEASLRNSCSPIPRTRQMRCLGELFKSWWNCTVSAGPAGVDSTSRRSGSSPLLKSNWACGYPPDSITRCPALSKTILTNERASAFRMTVRTTRSGLTRHLSRKSLQFVQHRSKTVAHAVRLRRFRVPGGIRCGRCSQRRTCLSGETVRLRPLVGSHTIFQNSKICGLGLKSTATIHIPVRQ